MQEDGDGRIVLELHWLGKHVVYLVCIFDVLWLCWDPVDFTGGRNFLSPSHPSHHSSS